MVRLRSNVSFPKQYIALLTNSIKSAEDLRKPGPFLFRIPKTMTKLELKEYLTKIYDMNVRKVNTLIQIGKYYRHIARPKKEKDFKKAYVTFNVNGFDAPKTSRHPNLRLPGEKGFQTKKRTSIFLGQKQPKTQQRIQRKISMRIRAKQRGNPTVDNPQKSTPVNAWNKMAKSWKQSIVKQSSSTSDKKSSS